MPLVYAVGKNMVGYLPEGDVYFTLDYESAKQALMADLDRYGDDMYDAGEAYDETCHVLSAEAFTAMEDLNLCAVTDANGGAFDAYIGDLHFWLIAEPPAYFDLVDDDTLEAQIDDANDAY